MTNPTSRSPSLPAQHALARRAGLAAAVLAASALVAGVAVARPGHPGPGKGHHDAGLRIERALEKLELDEATRESAYAVIDAARPAHRDVRARMREAHRALRALLEQDAPDAEAVMAQAEVVGALRTEVRKQHLATLLEVQALLTPEQRERLREMARHRGPGRRGGCGDR